MAGVWSFDESFAMLAWVDYQVTTVGTSFAACCIAGATDSMHSQPALAPVLVHPGTSPASGMHDAGSLYRQQPPQREPQLPTAQPQSTSDIFSMLMSDS